MNISFVQKVVKGYNNAGFKLITRKNGLEAREIMSGVKMPKNAVTMDYVQVECEYGNGLKTIVQYKDKDGKLLKHAMKEYHGGNLSGKMVQDYENYGYIQDINTTKYNGVGKLKENIDESISVRWGETDSIGQIISDRPHAIRIKLITTPLGKGSRKESQVIEHLYTGGKRDYIQTEAIRHKDGRLTHSHDCGNLPNTTELSQDPYLYIRNYSKSDFAQSAMHIAQKEQHVSHRNIQKIVEPIKRKTTHGYATSGGKVVIDADKAYTKQDLVDTINHEMRHQYQFDQIDALGFWKSFLLGKRTTTLNCEEQEMAKKFLKAKILYCPPCISRKLYTNNFMEVDARKYGAEAAKKFNEYSLNLAKSFGATTAQYPLFQAEYQALKDSVFGLIRGLKKQIEIKNLKIKNWN